MMGEFTARKLGSLVEGCACDYLKNRGYLIIERNFACRFGEIDVVAFKGKTLVFFEVRYRKKGSLVKPEESVDGRKVNRLRLAIREFLYRYPGAADRFESIRVDLIAVTGDFQPGGNLRTKPMLVFEILQGIVEF